MARIPIAQVPQLRNAPFQQTASAGALSAPGAAMQQLGGAIQQSAKVVGAFHEKKQTALYNGQKAKALIELENANADVQIHMEKNPDNTQSWTEFAEKRYGEVESKLTFDGLSGEQIQSLQGDIALRSSKDAVGFRWQAEKRDIENSKALVMQAAQTAIDRGNIDEAVALMNGDSDIEGETGGSAFTAAERIDFLHREINASFYSKVGMQLEALRDGDPEELRQFKEDLLSKDGDAYKTHIESLAVNMGGGEKSKQIIEVSGLSVGQRESLAKLADQYANKVVSSQNRNLNSLVRSAKSGDIEGAQRAFNDMRDEDGANGLPVDYDDEQVEKMIQDAYDAKVEAQNIDSLRKAANTGDTKEDYVEVESRLKAAFGDANDLREFDLKDTLSKIQSADYSNAVKALQTQQALEMEAKRLLESNPPEEGLGSHVWRWLSFGMYEPEEFSKVSAPERDLIVSGFDEINYLMFGDEDTPGRGNFEGVDSAILDYQKAVRGLFNREENPTQEQKDELFNKHIKPLQIDAIRQQAFGQ